MRMKRDVPRILLYAVVLIAGFLVAVPFVFSFDASSKGKESGVVIRFGTLPVLQALPLFVAAEKGYFREQGINVELITFNSAMEKDVAITSGQISGYFGDMLTPMVLSANKVPVKMVATIFSTPKTRRMFAIVSSPASGDKGLKELAQAGISVSSNTILDYLTTRLLELKGIQAGHAKTIEIKSIPIRLQMLLAGQVPAAILPEPLVTLAEARGARVLVDDAGTGFSPTVLVFNEKFLLGNPLAVKSFLAAVEKASLYINKNHAEVRATMNRECKVPEPLKQTFPIPGFPRLERPVAAQVMDVARWLQRKGITKSELEYPQVVADGYLP
jgi:NitT/TauT family transport system substrate-binding protein